MAACDWDCLRQWLLFVIFAFCTPFYSLFTMMLVRFRKWTLSEPFFTIVLVVGCNEVLISLHNWFAWNFRIWGWWFEAYVWTDQLLMRPHMWYSWGAAQVSIGNTLLIAANRFTALVYPMQYKKVWTYASTWRIIAATYIVSFLSAAPMAVVGEYHTIKIGNATGALLLYDNPQAMAVAYKVLAIEVLSASIVVLCMYAAMGYSLKGYLQAKDGPKNAAEKLQQAKQRRVQLNLALSGGCIALAMVLYSMPLYQLSFNADWSNYQFWWSLTASIWIYCNPFVLLFCSTQTREKFIAFIFCRSSSG